MKFIFLGVFVFFFVYMPMKLLDTLVMPQLLSLEHIYQQAGTVAEQAAGTSAPAIQYRGGGTPR